MNKTTKIAIAALVLVLASTGFAQEAGAVTENLPANDPNNNAGLSAIGKGLAVGLGALASGIAQSRIGSAAVGAVAEDSSKFGTMLIFLLLPETLVIFGLLALFIIK